MPGPHTLHRRTRRVTGRASYWNGGAPMRELGSAAAPKPERAGVLAVLQEQPMTDRLQGLMQELQLEDELAISGTLDAALRCIRTGFVPRVLFLDLAESPAPIAEVSTARTGGCAAAGLAMPQDTVQGTSLVQ